MSKLSLVFGLLLSSLLVNESPKVVRMDGERVNEKEVMIFTRSKLIEAGPSVNRMRGHRENIDTVLYNFNTFRLGYSVASKQVGGVYEFSGPTKCWRATSVRDVSQWPENKYPVSRNEAIRRAMSLRPILLTEAVNEEKNLRLYYLPSLVDYKNGKYKIEPTAIAFFIHPETGRRMTVMIREERTYANVDKPLTATSNVYVEETVSYSAGPFGLGTAYVPSVFYSKKVQFDVEPFALDNAFVSLLNSALVSVEKNQALSVEDFKALYEEMSKYTK